MQSLGFDNLLHPLGFVLTPGHSGFFLSHLEDPTDLISCHDEASVFHAAIRLTELRAYRSAHAAVKKQIVDRLFSRAFDAASQ